MISVGNFINLIKFNYFLAHIDHVGLHGSHVIKLANLKHLSNL